MNRWSGDLWAGVWAGQFAIPAAGQQLPSRWMDDLNWMEFREIVPAKVKTVLLTTGTLEPHGVANNGADNLAPVKITEAIAPEVNALIAPHIPYGVTGSMGPCPGATHIPAEVYAPYVRAARFRPEEGRRVFPPRQRLRGRAGEGHAATLERSGPELSRATNRLCFTKPRAWLIFGGGGKSEASPAVAPGKVDIAGRCNA